MKNYLTFKSTSFKQISQWILPNGVAAVIGIGCGTLLLNEQNVVHCKVKHREKNRLVGQTDHDPKKPELGFDWKQFFQILWPDIYSLALAIVVCTCIIYFLSGI